MTQTINLMILLLAVVMAAALPAQAAWAPNEREMASLPPYCAARFDQSSPAFKTWQASMGSDFIHVHHYCAGLNFLNRSYGMASAKDRQGTLGGALRNFDYMLTQTQPDFILRPEILLHRGITLSLLRKPGEAINNLNQAIDLNAKLPRAYLALADIYDKQKNRAKALEIVTEGLRHNPDTKSLQRRYTELGGKLPYPEPIEPTPAVEAEAAKPEGPSTSPPSSVEPASSPTGVQPAPVEPIAEPQIGSPTNPHCRFCPD